MEARTDRKSSAKPNLDIAKAIATLQEQVKANSEAIKQALPRDKIQVSNNTALSIVFVVLVVLVGWVGWVKIDQNELREELSNTRQELSRKIDFNYKELSSKIDINHKQILDILVKRK